MKLPRSVPRARAGTALVSVTILCGALAMMAYCLTTVSAVTASERRGSQQNWSAIQVAEAGLSEAVASMARGESGALGSEGAPVAFGPTTYWVERSELDDDRVRLVSTGIAGGSRASIELLVEAGAGTNGTWGVFGLEWLHLDSNAMVDSYSSSDGSYESQVDDRFRGRRLADDEILVGSNGSVSLDQNAIVWGDVEAGPEATVEVNGNAYVSGGSGTMQEPQEFPEVEIPELVSAGNLSVIGGLASWIPAGEHRFDELVVGTGGSLFVVGPATIVVDSLRLRSNSRLWVQAVNGPVEIIVREDLIMESNASAHPMDFDPGNLSISFAGDTRERDDLEIFFDSGTKLYGTLYMPGADVVIDSNFTLYGSLVARTVSLSSNCAVHFDTDLETFGGDEDAVLERRSWRLLNVGRADLLAGAH